MSDSDLSAEQRIQESQYDYPYHYIPRMEDGRFSQLQYWSWGMHYLGGIRVVLDQLDPWSFDSLIDVGCGDGRFLRELAAERPSVDSLGIDYSERSIAMARGMNPDLDYDVVDLLSEDVGREFDVATAIEVLDFIVNSPSIVDTLWRLYRRRYLYADSESNCRRIAAVCHR